jgi:hypothetical protein
MYRNAILDNSLEKCFKFYAIDAGNDDKCIKRPLFDVSGEKPLFLSGKNELQHCHE